MPVIPRMAMAAAIMIFFLFGFLGFFSVVPASRESSSLSNSSGEIFSSDSGSEDLKAGLCCVLAGAQALRCALRMWLC